MRRISIQLHHAGRSLGRPWCEPDASIWRGTSYQADSDRWVTSEPRELANVSRGTLTIRERTGQGRWRGLRGRHRDCLISPFFSFWWSRPQGLRRSTGNPSGWHLERQHTAAPLANHLIPAASRNFKHYFPSRFSVRSRNLLIKASAPPAAMIEANSSRRMARSLMVPLR